VPPKLLKPVPDGDDFLEKCAELDEMNREWEAEWVTHTTARKLSIEIQRDLFDARRDEADAPPRHRLAEGGGARRARQAVRVDRRSPAGEELRPRSEGERDAKRGGRREQERVAAQPLLLLGQLSHGVAPPPPIRRQPLDDVARSRVARARAVALGAAQLGAPL